MKFGRSVLALQAVLVLISAPVGARLTLPEFSADKKSPAYARFRSWVDEALAGSPDYGFSAADAAILAHLSGDRKYCALAVQVTDEQVKHAEEAITKGETPEVARDSYLQVGPMIADVSLAYDECGSSTTAEQRARWSAYAERTLENVWNPHDAQWGDKPTAWTGWAIDNPGNNYYSSFLKATMYWALASGNTRWLQFLRDDKLPAAVGYFSKITGGSTREGTGYGTSLGRLFSTFNVWRSSTGADLNTIDGFVADTISYWVHATMPTLDRFAPIGDQARVSIPDIYDYQRCLMLQARKFTENDRARKLASWWLHSISIGHMTNGFNYACDLLPAGSDAAAPTERVYEASGTGQLFARTDWSRDALWLNFTAGPYTEGHAHQDQGNFTLFKGDWLAVTQNIWSRSGIQQGTETNNVVRFVRAGTVIEQRLPSHPIMRVMHADTSNGDVAATADLTPAYLPHDGVRMWQRDIEFSKGTLKVHDRFKLDQGVHATFQVNVPRKPTIKGSEAVAGRLHLKVIEPENATLTALDWETLDADEAGSGWRIDIEGAGSEFVVEMNTASK